MTSELNNEKLDKIIRLLALMLIKNENGDEQIKALMHANLTPLEISQIVNKDGNTVRQAIFRINKSTKQKSDKPKKPVIKK